MVEGKERGGEVGDAEGVVIFFSPLFFFFFFSSFFFIFLMPVNINISKISAHPVLS